MRYIYILALFPFFVACTSGDKFLKKKIVPQTHANAKPKTIKVGDDIPTVRKKMHGKPDLTIKNLTGEHLYIEVYRGGEKSLTGKTYSVVKTSKSIIGRLTGIDPIGLWNNSVSVLTKKDTSIRWTSFIIRIDYTPNLRVKTVTEEVAPRAYINTPR